MRHYNSNCVILFSLFKAPKKFQGTVEVQSLRITDAETFTWKEELGNKSSALFSATAMVFRIQVVISTVSDFCHTLIILIESLRSFN